MAAVQRRLCLERLAAHWPPAAGRQSSNRSGTACPAAFLQNQPLYLATFAGDEDTARLSTMVHCSLDAVEEKGAPAACRCCLQQLPAVLPAARAAAWRPGWRQ